MIQTTPKVYLLASTDVSMWGVREWLTDVDGYECLSHVTGTPAERLIELAGRRCYKAFKAGLNPNVKTIRENSEDYHANLLKQRHGSVLEHSSTTFAIEYCSRVFTHELVRHRVGMAYSQESLRYVRLTQLGIGIPDCIKNNEEAMGVFTDTVEYAEHAQRRLSAIFDIDELTFAEKKILTSAFRRIAPIGLSTGIVMTANFRALRWLIEHRTGPEVESEMRVIMGMVANIAMQTWPMVFGDFTRMEDGSYVTPNHKV